jgi:hypothetical protein
MWKSNKMVLEFQKMTGANGHTNELDLPLKRSLTALK